MTIPTPSAATKHVVIGAGPAGRATAKYLQAQGHHVSLVSRSGTGPEVAGVHRIPLDATDSNALTDVVDGAAAMYNCMNPTAYTRWAQEWPPLHRSLLHAAQTTGAVLVTLSNLYMYGPMRQHALITPHSTEQPQDAKGEIRGRMDRETLHAHQRGALRAVIVRASDFIGPELGDNGHATRNIPTIAAGRTVRVIGSADQPHSWTNIDDVAATLATVAARDDTHGRIWFAPTNPPVTQRELTGDLARALNRPTPKVSAVPQRMLKLLALASPMLRELHSISYQFTNPWVIDSSATTRTLGLHPTDWETIIQQAAHGNLPQPS